MSKVATKIDAREVRERCGDAFIEIAQLLEKSAKRYRELAKGYRNGEFNPAYTNMPPETHPSLLGPAVRAADCISPYDITNVMDRLREELLALK